MLVVSLYCSACIFSVRFGFGVFRDFHGAVDFTDEHFELERK